MLVSLSENFPVLVSQFIPQPLNRLHFDARKVSYLSFAVGRCLLIVFKGSAAHPHFTYRRSCVAEVLSSRCLPPILYCLDLRKGLGARNDIQYHGQEERSHRSVARDRRRDHIRLEIHGACTKYTRY